MNKNNHPNANELGNMVTILEEQLVRLDQAGAAIAAIYIDAAIQQLRSNLLVVAADGSAQRNPSLICS